MFLAPPSAWMPPPSRLALANVGRVRKKQAGEMMPAAPRVPRPPRSVQAPRLKRRAVRLIAASKVPRPARQAVPHNEQSCYARVGAKW